MSAPDRLRSIIAERGPLRWDELVELALYDPDDGFYRAGGHAGRRAGDFITSPEVGPLFGAVLAGVLDAHWRQLGEPSRFRVVEVGASRGTLARTIQVAEPACRVALRYALIETSAALRAEQPRGDMFEHGSTMPDEADIVIANELLDNLPFRVARLHERTWHDIVVTADPAQEALGPPVDLTALSTEAATVLDSLAGTVADGTDIPIADGAGEWVREARTVAPRVLVFDYGASTSELAGRPERGWLRTYANQQRGGHPLENLGDQDITIDVPVDQLPTPTTTATQAEWLGANGIDELVAAGQREWTERAAIGDLAALRARSRAVEAAALVDPIGLGDFVVMEWREAG